MPHTTYRYPFESKVFAWASAFSARLTGDERGFLLLLDADGAVRQVQTGDQAGHFDLELRERLVTGHPH